MDLHELESKTVNELRELAGGYEDIEGASGLKKNELIDILCQKLGIDQHRHVPTGIGRRDLRARIRVLKQLRDQALEKKDAQQLATVRREIKFNKRRLTRLITQALRTAEKPKSSPAEAAG